MSDRAGTRFGPYQLIDLLGRGGMGEVYRAHDTVKDRVVAVKLLPPHLAQNPDYEQRFEREARTAASVTDPHVVPIHDYGRIEGVLFLEMPFVQGTDLRHILDAEGPLSLERTARIVEQVAGALDAVHAVGLTHRDVKPENILVTGDDFCYLADFGIASGVDDTRLTQQGAAVGSLRYMAPERFDDRPAVPATDTYALGCIAYEMLAGRQAFAGRSVQSITREQLDSYPPPPPESVPGAAATALRQAIDKDPAQRQLSSGEFAQQLRAAVPVQVVHKKWSRWQWVAAVTAVILAVSVGTAVGVRIFGGDEPQTVVLMPADQTSSNGFTESVVTTKPSETVAQKHVRRDAKSAGTAGGSTPTAAAVLSGTESARGNAKDLYGVPGDESSVCDTARLVQLITKDKTRATVWADLLGTTPSKIASMVRSLTPLILRADTLVVNSDYKNGKPVQYPAVLQAGTAVLADRYGVPRVKCNCGNPLAQAPKDRPEKVSGTPWKDWTGKAVTVATTSEPITDFTVTDVATGKKTTRQRGSVVTKADDAITKYDFSNTTWKVQDDETITLTDGTFNETGAGYAKWTLMTRSPKNKAVLPDPVDVNGDGYLDLIQGLDFAERAAASPRHRTRK